MNSCAELRIEPLGRHPEICVLKDGRGTSLGTGSRETLEVLLYVVEKWVETNNRKTNGVSTVTRV
jgi:hypothetical protein